MVLAKSIKVQPHLTDGASGHKKTTKISLQVQKKTAEINNVADRYE